MATDQQGMAKVRPAKATGRIATRKGEAIVDLMLEVAQYFFTARHRSKTGSSQAGAAARSDSCAAWR